MQNRHLTKWAVIVMLALFFPAIAYAQQMRKVHGTVKDASGEPLAGAAVMTTVNGKAKGAITDGEGKYSLDIPSSATSVEFSFIGMKPQTVLVKPNASEVNITLESDNTIAEAVVNAGYGVVQKRIDMTGSAYQVSSEEIKSLPKGNVAGMLDGIVPGLTVAQSQTGARDTYKLRVRGDASLSANCEPLWIVDDVPLYTGSTTGNTVTGMSYSVSPISFLNPEDIESITVLKDAASTSIYGADGANGVILVTTKKGAYEGKLDVQATIKHGISKIDGSTLMRLCNTKQWWSLATEAWTNAGYDMANFPYQDNPMNSYSTTDTNWYDVYLGMGNNSDVSVTVRSGDKKVGNYLSLSYFNEDYTLKGNNTKRISLRDRINYQISKKFKADLNFNASYNLNDIFYLGSNYLRVIPIFSPYDEDGKTPRLYNCYSRETGSYSPEERRFVYNGVPKRELSDNDQYALSLGASANLVYTITKGLTATVMGGINNATSCEFLYDPSTTLDGITSYEMNGSSRRAAATSMNWTNIDRLNFNRTFGKFNVNALAGVEFKSTTSRSLYAYGYGFANDSIKELAYAISSSTKGSSSAYNSRSLSYMASGSVSYDNRYVLSASYRRQGNSAFSTYNQWDDFASAGLAWNVDREKFWNVPAISKLKLRASYGNSGNSRVNTSAAYGTYTVTSGSYYGGLAGATQASTPNPGLSWEKTDILNVGLDLGILDNRVTFSFEGYDKYTHDMLYSGRVSSIIDNGSVVRNVGSMQNVGFEALVSANIIRKENFDWTVQMNGSFNKNKILQLYQDMHTGFFDYVWVKGASKNAWWLSRWAGVDPATGAPMWYDANGDLTHNFSYDNRVLLPDYDKQPSFEGGLVNNLKWGRFSVRMQLNYCFGGWEFLNYYGDGYDILDFNTIVEELDHWREPGDVSANPAFVYKNSSSSTLGSTRFLYSKTHIQLKNIALYYDLPKSVSKWLRVRNVQVSLIGDNLYFWSPEQSKDKNSYKTMAFNRGITRAVSGQIQIDF
jgi:TonB-linked outer membrane protein, SusC/RagA family/TonB-dependent outer membrane receptor, SusC/RagA subfamily, signature region